jgi:hypothetical protein
MTTTVADSRRLVDKLWSYCDVLRDDGVGVIEYTEQLTYLLFLKMAHERATRKLRPQQIVPEEYSWQKLLDAQGDQLEFEYTRILNGLARQPGVIGTIFRKAQNRIQDPAKLKRLVVDLIDKENWSGTGTDIKGDAYEELLSKGASDKGSGAGQYFTPRALIQAIVDVIQPTVDDTVVDPACGTGGFLLVASEYAAQGAESMTPDSAAKLQDSSCQRLRARRRHRPAGRHEPAAARHGHRRRRLPHRGPGLAHRRPGSALVGRALEPAVREEVVADDGRCRRTRGARGPGDRAPGLRRDDEQQATQLRPAHHDDPRHQRPRCSRPARQRPLRGRRRRDDPPQAPHRLRPAHDAAPADRHLLRPGRQGQRALLRQEGRPPRPTVDRACGSTTCARTSTSPSSRTPSGEPISRTSSRHTSREQRGEREECERWKSFTYDEITARDKANLDITWLRDESLEDLDNLPSPDVLAREIVEDLSAALQEFEAVATALEEQLARPVE